MRRLAILLCALSVLAVMLAGTGCDAPTAQQATSVASTASPSFSFEPTKAPATPEVLDIVYTPQPTETPEQTAPSTPAPSTPDPQPAAQPSGPDTQSTTFEAQNKPVHMRAVWVASVLNIDFPKAQGDAEAQKSEFVQILENTLSWGLDTVIVQVRPMGDALYRSSLNPWSSFLTGTQGQDPGWDPLAFMIEEAHKRGISLHAWLNPYRVTHPVASFTTANLAEDSLARQHPEWLIEHDGVTQYDPAREEVKQHIADTVKEIVDNYEVDGIHFDDYFYPAGYPLPEGAEKDGILDRERREHVNDMLRRVHAVCAAAPHKVVFGVSPFGIWKNSTSDPAGSNTAGNESYYAMAADSVRWIQEGIIDYIAPQLYWPIGHELADYDTLLHWWAQQTQGTDVSLIIGQGVYNEAVAADIGAELALNATVSEVTGSIFYNYSTLADSPTVADVVRDFYAERNGSVAASLNGDEGS